MSIWVIAVSEKSVERLKPEDERGRITGQAELVTLESEVEAVCF